MIPAFQLTPRLIALAAGVAVALFAIAFLVAGGGASSEAAKPGGEVRVSAPAPARIGTLRSIGNLPAAPAARKPKRKAPKRAAAKRTPVARPPAAGTPPPVFAPPPPPPPPPEFTPDPGCVGALC